MSESNTQTASRIDGHTAYWMLELATLNDGEIKGLSILDDYLATFTQEHRIETLNRWRAEKYELRLITSFAKNHFKRERQKQRRDAKLMPLYRIVAARDSLLANPADFEASKRLAAAQKEFEKAMLRHFGLHQLNFCEQALQGFYGFGPKKAKGGAKVS